MTKIQIIKTMKCPSDKKFDSVHKKLQECSNIIVDKLELEFSCKLRAENPSDTVNGSVTILHEDSKHIIDIVFYDKDESANIERLTTFKKLKKIPSISDIKKII